MWLIQILKHIILRILIHLTRTVAFSGLACPWTHPSNEELSGRMPQSVQTMYGPIPLQVIFSSQTSFMMFLKQVINSSIHKAVFWSIV